MTKRGLMAALLAAVLAGGLALAGCSGGRLKDGVYTGASAPDDSGAWGEARVTVREGRVSGCEYVTWQKDGTAKGADYGLVNGAAANRDYYEKAQFAVRAMGEYARRFAEAGSLKGVDAVSGATVSYNQFLEAAQDALDKARK
jgi:major membrane immunogen (membrane-anchored lipoprotein)